MKKELEVILNSTFDAIVAIDRKGVIILFNKVAEKLTGIKQHLALGKPGVDVISDLDLTSVFKTGMSEYNCQQSFGDTKIVVNKAPIKDIEGNIIGAVAAFRDVTELLDLDKQITELKEIKSMFQAIFNATQEAISVADIHGVNLMINPAYTKITRLKEEDIIGKPATADIVEGESIHMKVLSTKKPVKKARMKVGTNRTDIIANAAPIIVDGELRGSVAILDDVSEIIKLTKELNEAKQIIRKLEAKYTFDDIVGSNKLMQNAIEKAKVAARTPATVLLRGESGTGKELFAHAIHNSSSRKFNQFVRVNCGALSETLLESELFGYIEGAFTGAKKGGKKGLFEEASGGTIFLDEIGDISLNTQIKLLRVLQEKEIVRVGDTKPINVDVRVIAATNMNLEEAIVDGRFREDLYYRINVVPINIPALRLRKDDIYSLSLHYIQKFNQEYGRSVKGISLSAVQMLNEYDWPGNVRELGNVIGRSIINMMHNESTILETHIPELNIKYSNVSEPDNLLENNIIDNEDRKLKDILSEAEKKIILMTLKKYNNDKTKTAKALGISIRSFYYKLEKHNIEI